MNESNVGIGGYGMRQEILSIYQQVEDSRTTAQTQQQAAQMQWQRDSISNYPYLLMGYKPPNVFVPITQEEVDMAEAWYEVDKIAPGLPEERR